MDLLENSVNRRLMFGSFPVEKLFPVSIEDCPKIDFRREAAEGLSFFKEYPKSFTFLFLVCRNIVEELDKIQMPQSYSNEINCYINTNYSPDTMNVKGVIQDTFNLCPVITPLDKILWRGIFEYQFEDEFVKTEKAYNPKKMMFAWIYLLQVVQEKEINTGKTIDIKYIDIESDVVGIILNKWNNINQKYLIPLTKKQVRDFSLLNDKKNRLLEKVHEEKQLSKEIAKKTDNDWILFLKMINDLSEKESNAISNINEVASVSDKKRIIGEYRSVLRNIEKGKYNLDGLEINLLGVFDSVIERMNNASYYANAKIVNGVPFRMHHAALLLAMKPHTYNYLLMIFHEFRISPNKETAKQFVALALSSIKKNLGSEEKSFISMDDMIEEFALTVFGFVDNNKTAINSLSFDKIQVDTLTMDATSQITQESDIYSDKLTQFINEYQNSKNYDKDIEAIIEGNGRIYSKEEILYHIEKQEEMNTQIEKEAMSQRLIYSLNIIYLFCEALRIMLNNKHAHVKIKKREKAEHIRGKLLDLDAELVHIVYSGISEEELNMREYREKTGVISVNLSEQEYQEERFRNNVCFGVLKEAVNELISHIEDKDTERIIDAKKKIKEEILRVPDFENKSVYVEWLDSISTRICNALINNCRRKEEEYTEIKSNIINCLGDNSNRLPASSIDSLTTAEMLFGNYATDEFAEQGFDFSCISALYYQAFEDAYNGLIWRDYAERLNTLIIGDRSYTEILKEHQYTNLFDSNYLGYLHRRKKQRNYYVQFSSTTASVSLRCMYKSFAIMMESINQTGELDKFCDYFAEITGYASKNDMFRDTSFMDKCTEFTRAVNDSTVNRNNASHGGTFISKDQCTADKKTVLNDLEDVRSSSIGLIQQLLYLLYKE